MKNCITYIIKPRDTLYRIAKEYGTTVERILFDNAGLDPYNLQIGSAITVCRDCDCVAPEPPLPPPTGVMPEVPPIVKPPMRPELPIGTIPPVMPEPPIGIVPPDCSNLFKWVVLFGAMRTVWLDHVYWTRLFLVSVAHKLKDEPATTARLLQNPGDIAAIYANFYPPEVTDNLKRLLTEHLEIGGQLIHALRDGEDKKAEELTHLWYKNAEEMATAFAQMNPNYDRKKVSAMLRSHLDKTTAEVAARLKGDYAADIAAFEEVKNEAIEMADYFSAGLADMM